MGSDIPQVLKVLKQAAQDLTDFVNKRKIAAGFLGFALSALVGLVLAPIQAALGVLVALGILSAAAVTAFTDLFQSIAETGTGLENLNWMIDELQNAEDYGAPYIDFWFSDAETVAHCKNLGAETECTGETVYDTLNSYVPNRTGNPYHSTSVTYEFQQYLGGRIGTRPQ